MRIRTASIVVGAVLWATVASAQGHGYTPGDIENGGLLYQANCTACHGPEGDGVASVNLGSGRFRRGTTDDEIVKIIIGGIPGTAMPPSAFSEGQAGTIVAYLRSLAAAPESARFVPGDAARGKAVFDGKGGCLNCHSVAGVGARTAVSLTEIGALRRAVDLQKSIVDPGGEIRSDQRPVRIATREGATINGRLLNHDTYTIQLLDSNGRLRLIEKSAVKEFTIPKESSMPSYRDTLDAQELADIVTYLTTLRGKR